MEDRTLLPTTLPSYECSIYCDSRCERCFVWRDKFPAEGPRICRDCQKGRSTPWRSKLKREREQDLVPVKRRRIEQVSGFYRLSNEVLELLKRYLDLRSRLRLSLVCVLLHNVYLLPHPLEFLCLVCKRTKPWHPRSRFKATGGVRKEIRSLEEGALFCKSCRGWESCVVCKSWFIPNAESIKNRVPKDHCNRCFLRLSLERDSLSGADP